MAFEQLMAEATAKREKKEDKDKKKDEKKSHHMFGRSSNGKTEEKATSST